MGSQAQRAPQTAGPEEGGVMRYHAQIKLRLPEELREKVEAAALSGSTSMNAEMVRRLELTFRNDEVLARLDRVEKLLLSL